MALKICVVGCGNHSSMVHGPSYVRYVREYPDTVLAACCDWDAQRAETYREKYGFRRSYTDMTRMLETEKPDAVCVIVPEHLVCPTSIAVMEMGFNILLEKPPGLCLADTERMVRTAEKAGVINQVAFNRRYLPLYSRLKELVAQHGKDSVQGLFYEFYRCHRTEPSFETTAIHGIDAARHIIGCDYQEVRFAYQPLENIGHNVVNILMDCVFENGVYGRINFCPCTGLTVERICVNAADQSFLVNTPIWDGFDTPGELLHVVQGKTVRQISGLEVCESQEMYETNGFCDENRAFFEDVRAGRKCENDIRSTLQPVALAEEIKKRSVYWKKS